MNTETMVFNDSQWIWIEGSTAENEWLTFRKEFELLKVPKSVLAIISASNIYNLYVNGVLLIFNGSLAPSASVPNGYYDTIELAKKLKKGRNVVSVEVKARAENNRLLVDMNEINVISDGSFTVNRAQVIEKVVTLGEGFTNDEGLMERPIPLYYFSPKFSKGKITIDGNKKIMALPYAMHVVPQLSVISVAGGEHIEVMTDRFVTHNIATDKDVVGKKLEFTLNMGINEFEGKEALCGENLIFIIPDGVKIKSLAYREVSYDSSIKASFECSDSRIDTLVAKCNRNLRYNMLDEISFAIDISNLSFIGATNTAVSQMLCSMDSDSLPLVRKTIDDFLASAKEGVLSCVSKGFYDVPCAALSALSEFGIIAKYFALTHDLDLLRTALPITIEYLRLWELDDDGLVNVRDGDLKWHDYHFNIDDKLIENCWYYSALKFCKRVQNLLSDMSHDNFISPRMDRISKGFEKYARAKGYSSSVKYDERANALAVLVGLAKENLYDGISEILRTVFTASPYMESYIVEALCELNHFKYAYDRIIHRYGNMIDSKSSTLEEDFFFSGSKACVWSGGILSTLYKYFAGVNLFNDGKSIIVTPNTQAFEWLKFTMPIADGIISGLYRTLPTNVEIFIDNGTKLEGKIVIKSEFLGTKEDKVIKLSRGRNKFLLERTSNAQ